MLKSGRATLQPFTLSADTHLIKTMGNVGGLSTSQIPTALQKTLQHAVDIGVPGVSAAISNSNGILWQGSAGSSNILKSEPVDANKHIFGVGSITKVFVAVVTLQLLDENRLSLSDKASSYLPPEILRDIPNASTATLSELLSHMSGVPSAEDDPVWIVEGRGRDLDPDKMWTKSETLDYIRHPLSDPSITPGEFSYSNSGYTILGLVIEKITGFTVESEIRRRILKRLGMEDTYMEGFEEAQPERLPHRYHFATEEFRETAGVCPRFTEPRPGLIDASASNMSVEWVAGGLISSQKDLLTFAMALRSGQLLSPEATKLMQEWKTAEDKVMIGLGLFRIQNEQGMWLGHTGSTLGFTGCFCWAEEADCAIAVLCNVGTMHCGYVPSHATTIALKTEFSELALELASEQSKASGSREPV